jgi:hypothetical protein
VWISLSRHSPDWRVIKNFHSPNKKTTRDWGINSKEENIGEWFFLFLLAKPEFHSHLSSWWVVIRFPAVSKKTNFTWLFLVRDCHNYAATHYPPPVDAPSRGICILAISHVKNLWNKITAKPKKTTEKLKFTGQETTWHGFVCFVFFFLTCTMNPKWKVNKYHFSQSGNFS